MWSRRCLSAALGALLVSAHAAAAPVCEAAYEHAQTDRNASHLLAAKRELLRCAARDCPGLMRADCGKWLDEVDASTPTVIPSARTASGRELSDVRVLLDGRLAKTGLDGRAIALDPGAYTLTFEAPGRHAVRVSFVAKAGEKNRVIQATFAEPPAPAPSHAPPAGFWVLGGVGVAALASFATFAILGETRYRDLKSSCAPRCDPADSDAVHARFLAADISLGVAALAGAGAAWIYLSPSQDGATITARASF